MYLSYALTRYLSPSSTFTPLRSHSRLGVGSPSNEARNLPTPPSSAKQRRGLMMNEGFDSRETRDARDVTPDEPDVAENINKLEIRKLHLWWSETDVDFC